MGYQPVILAQEDYEEIRDRLGNASPDLIPDVTVEKTSYLQRAEAIVRGRVPDYAAIISGAPTDPVKADKLIHMKVATIALTAALLIPKVQELVKQEKIVDYNWMALDMSEWKNKIEMLMTEYSNSLSHLSYGAAGVVPTLLVVTGPSSVATDPLYYTSIEIIGADSASPAA